MSAQLACAVSYCANVFVRLLSMRVSSSRLPYIAFRVCCCCRPLLNHHRFPPPPPPLRFHGGYFRAKHSIPTPKHLSSSLVTSIRLPKHAVLHHLLPRSVATLRPSGTQDNRSPQWQNYLPVLAMETPPSTEAMQHSHKILCAPPPQHRLH